MNGAFDLAKVRVAVSNTVVRSTETLPAPSAVGGFVGFAALLTEPWVEFACARRPPRSFRAV